MKTRVNNRVQTWFSSEARFPGASAVASILDISISGCRMKTDEKSAKIGTTIVLQLADNHYASGEIVRKVGTNFGVHFHRPVGDAIIDQIAARLE